MVYEVLYPLLDHGHLGGEVGRQLAGHLGHQAVVVQAAPGLMGGGGGFRWIIVIRSTRVRSLWVQTVLKE